MLLQILNGPSCEQHNSSKVFNINQPLLSELNMFYKVHLFKVLLQRRHYHAAVIAFPFHRHQPFHIKIYKHWGGEGGSPSLRYQSSGGYSMAPRCSIRHVGQ